VGRMTVGLLAAVGAVASGLAAFVHGDQVGAALAAGASSTGLAAFLAIPSKKTLWCPIST
jgi:hypothetical protein